MEKDNILSRFINIENIINSVNEFYGYKKIIEIISVKYCANEIEIHAKNEKEEFCLNFNYKEES